jgi:hypothetical protein
MPLQKLQFRPGLNREGTDYSNEGGWYDGDKIRFRSGFPEKIGGWTQYSPNQYNGVCRSIWVWLDGDSGVGNVYTGLGTNTNYYIYYGGVYNDITPIVQTDTLTNPFSTQNLSKTVIVTDGSYNPTAGDTVIFSGGSAVGGLTISGSYVVTSILSSSTYTITAASAATSTVASGGGTVTAQYDYPIGNTVYTVGTGWGAGPWSLTIPVTLGNNPFSISASSNVVTVTQTAHGYLSTAGTFTVGEQYKIVSTGGGSTDFTLIGATSNTVGTIFTATGVGTGTGTASIVWVAFTGATTLSTIPAIYGFTPGTYSVSASRGAALVGAVNDTITDNYLNGTFELTYVNANSYTITIQKTALANMVGGGNNVVAYPEYGTRGWGTAYSSGLGSQLRLWSNDNYGADLVIAPRGGPIFYWQDSGTVATRAQYLSSLANTTTILTLSTSTSDISFAGSATSITVSGTYAPSIYPYMVITGTNLPANTKVASTYVTGSTTVPITTTTSGSSSGSYNVSYAGAFVPTATYQVIASSIQEFVIAFGANSYSPHDANTAFNPMLVRWSDQANAYQWIPQLTNQSGEYLLTNGSYIMAAKTTRQEILVWTDSAIYSMQYLGAPYVWGFQVLMDNISVISPNSMITVNNVTYWMGKDRFYMYSGRVEVLPCALRQYIFADINQDQAYQVFAGANEAFNEVWWFYVSQSSANTVVDKYVIYNYLDRVWYYGNMGRTAWMQTGTQPYPIAADYNSRLLYHENGCDDLSTSATLPINAYVQSSDFDIGDGHNFGFVWRILPDVNFNGSSTNGPTVTMTVKPRQNSGTPYGAADNPQVQSAQNYTTIPQYTIQEFDGQVYTRLRGRQMSFRIESTGVGVAWQLGSPRIDIRPDGRR